MGGTGAVGLESGDAMTIFSVRNEFVTFTCEFMDTQYTYDLLMTDIGMAEESAGLRQRHVCGKDAWNLPHAILHDMKRGVRNSRRRRLGGRECPVAHASGMSCIVRIS